MLLVASLLGGTQALALSQRGHVFKFSFGAAGKGEAQFATPSAVAVNQSDGDVYVADHFNNRVEVFEPEVNAQGAISGEKYVRSFAVPRPESIAVDSSTSASDPSGGDIYVVGATAHEVKEEEPDKRIFKFSPDGKEITVLRKFKEEVEKGEEPEEAEELEETQGLAVDPSGNLFVYGAGAVDIFNNAAKKNRGKYSIAAPVGATRGLALDSHDNLYVGHESENPETAGPEGRPPVIGKLEALTGTPLIAELDQEASSAVTVNTADVPGSAVNEEDDVYITNVVGNPGKTLSSVAAFSSKGALLQRFSAAGLKEASGIAINNRNGTVYVADAASDDLDVFELEPPGRPTVDGLSAQVLTPAPSVANAIKLTAQIDPSGSDTRYNFEYGATSCSEDPPACTATAETDIGAGFADQAENLELQNLAPGSYHYRVTAANAHGATSSSERTFTILDTVSGLPDSRAWEMVSPPDKHAPIEPLTGAGGWIRASEDGNALTYLADGALTEEAQSNRSPEQQQILTIRGREGWSSQDLATPQSNAQGIDPGIPPEYEFFTPDLALALTAPFGDHVLAEPPLAPEATQNTLYLRDNSPLKPGASEQELYNQAQNNRGYLAPGYLPLLTESNVASGTQFGKQISFVDATPDLTHVVIESSVALTGSRSGPGLYEWAERKLHFVSVLPSGAAAPFPALGYFDVHATAIAGDGARVVWTNREEDKAGHLFVRDIANGATLQLDAAQGGQPEPQHGSAEFQTASSDGSRVFFTDKQRLTRDSTAEPGAENAGKADLYECEVAEENGKLACRLKDLTVDPNPGEHAAVQGLLLGANEDGSSIYLVARGVLAANESGNGETAQHGGDNLYELHHDGAGWSTTFIALLSNEDAPEWQGGEKANTTFLTARVSPSGRYLAFMTAAAPTGYDNLDQNSGKPDEEVYLYDSGTASLTCVSCDPAGTPPVGVLDSEAAGQEGLGLLVDRRRAWTGHWLAGSIPGWAAESVETALYQPRYLLDDGRLFFNSPADLVPQATNHKEDVYEYEPAGVGSCEGASGGCVALISSGTSAKESAFLEATPNGSDVFLLTVAQLLPQDTDTAFDIYDARVCTQESPCLRPPSPSPAGCSTSEVCRPAAPLEPASVGASGSATFSGSGNLLRPPPSNHEVSGLRTSSKPLTIAQKLSNALKACRKQHAKKKRKVCEALARRRYPPRRKAKQTRKLHKAGRGRSAGRETR